MNYNKRQFTKVNDKKVLHKVRKQWVTISVAMLGMLGLGVGTAYTSASASSNDDDESLEEHITNNFAKARKQAISQPMQHTANGRHMNAYDPKNIENQANLMTQHLMRLAGSNGQSASTPQKDGGQSNNPETDATKGNAPTSPKGTATEQGQQKKPVEPADTKETNKNQGPNTNKGGSKVTTNTSTQTNPQNSTHSGSNPSTSGTKHSTDNAGGNSNNQDHTGKNGSGKNVPSSNKNQNNSDLSATVWLNTSDGNRYSVNLSGHSDTTITAPNGQQYQLAKDNNGKVQIFAESDTDHKNNLMPYLLQHPQSLPSGINASDVNAEIQLKKFTLAPTVKINPSANNQNDYGYLSSNNAGQPSLQAKLITLYGYAGEYVKIPYSDIIVSYGKDDKNSDAITKLNDYSCSSDRSAIPSDKQLVANDNNLTVINDDNKQYTPYIIDNNGTKKYNVTFNGKDNDNYNNRNYVTYKLNSDGTASPVSNSMSLNYSPSVSSDLSIQANFEDPKTLKEYPITWTAKPGAPIYAPNGQVYQLYGNSINGGTQIFKYSDTQHLHPLATDPDHIINKDPLNNRITSLGNELQTFNFLPKLHFIDNSDGKSSDFTVNAIPVTIHGYKGQYVKIPYNDIYANVHTNSKNTDIQKITDPSTYYNYVPDLQSDSLPLSDYENSNKNYSSTYRDLLESTWLDSTTSTDKSTKSVSNSYNSDIILQSDKPSKSRKYLVVRLGGNEFNDKAPNENSIHYNVTPEGFNSNGSSSSDNNVITFHYHQDHVLMQYVVASDNGSGTLSDTKTVYSDKTPVSGPYSSDLKNKAGQIPYSDAFNNTLRANGLNPSNFALVPDASDSSNNRFQSVNSSSVKNANNSGEPSWVNPRKVQVRIINKAHHADQPMSMIIAPDSDENPQVGKNGVGLVTANLQGFINNNKKTKLPVMSNISDLSSIDVNSKYNHDTPFHDERTGAGFYDLIREWINNRNQQLANKYPSGSNYQEHDEIEVPTMKGITFTVKSNSQGTPQTYWNSDMTHAQYNTNNGDGQTSYKGQMVPVIRYRRMVQVNQTLPVEIASDKQQQTNKNAPKYHKFDKGSIHVQFPYAGSDGSYANSDDDELEFSDGGERTSDTDEGFIPLEKITNPDYKIIYDHMTSVNNAYSNTNYDVSDPNYSSHDSDQFKNWDAFIKTEFALDFNHLLNPNWAGASKYDESVSCPGYSNTPNPIDSMNWDYQNQMPILRYVSKVQDQFPVILKDQDGNVTYAYVSDTKPEPSDSRFTLSTGTNASSFNYISGQELPSNSDFQLCDVTPNSSDTSKYKMNSADLSNPNQLAQMGTGNNHTGFWIQPTQGLNYTKAGSDTKSGTWIDDNNWVPYSDWTKGTVGNEQNKGPKWSTNYNHSIPVLYYYRIQHVGISDPQVLVASDYQKSGYKLATLNNNNITSSFIAENTGTDKNPQYHIFGLQATNGSKNYPTQKDGNAEYFDVNWPISSDDIDAPSDSGLSGHQLDNSDQKSGGFDDPNTPTLRVRYNGASNKLSDLTNSKNWTTSWIFDPRANDSDKNSDNWHTINWNHNNSGDGVGISYSNDSSNDITTGYPVVRYIPKVTEDFKVWLGSDNQTSHYKPAIIQITSNARSSKTLSDAISNNNYELLDINGHPLSSDNYNFSDSNVSYTMSSDKLSDRENDNNYSDPSAKGNVGDVNPTINHLKLKKFGNLETPSDSITNYTKVPNWSNDPVNKDNWADGSKLPVLRRYHQRAAYLPVAFAPDPIYYDKDGNPVYLTKQGVSPTLNKADYIMGKVNISDTHEATHGKNRSNQADDQPNSDYHKQPISLNLNNITWDQSQLPKGTILDINSVNYILNHLPNYIPGSPNISASDQLNQIAHWDNFIQHISQDKNAQGKFIKKYSMTIGGNTVPGYEINLNSQSGNNTANKMIDSWINENWPDTQISKASDLDTPLVKQLKSDKVFVGIPVIRYMPVYQTPQMYQMERYYTPSVQAMQQHPSDFAKYYHDNNMTGPNGLVNTINPNNNDWQNYLNVPYHLNNGDNDKGNSTWINKSQGTSAPWLYNRNYGYTNGYFSNTGIKIPQQSVLGNLLPMRNSDVNAKDFNTTMGNNPHQTEMVEVTANGQPKMINHLSDSNSNNPSSDVFTFDLKNDFSGPTVESDKDNNSYESLNSNVNTFVDGVTGVNLMAYTNYGSINVKNGNSIQSESLNNVGSDTLFYPNGVNPIYVKASNGDLFPCPFISGHYYTPAINGSDADYSNLEPIKYDVNHLTLTPNQNKDNYQGMYKLPDNNHITHVKDYDIKFLNSTSQLNSSDLPESAPIFETHVLAPEGSEFHFHGDHLVLYETDPLGRTFPVAYLHQSSMTPSQINYNNNLLYKMNVPSDKFSVGSDWQSDSMNRTYNHTAGYAFDDTNADGMSDGQGNDVNMKIALKGNRLPEDVEKSLYNWRTTDNFTFDPNDPKPDTQGFYNSDFVYSNSSYNDNNGTPNTPGFNPDFQNYGKNPTGHNKLQYHSNYTYGISYLDSKNGKPINSTETQDVPLYVHPTAEKLVQINVNYINILDNYKLDSLSTNVLQPNDAPNFNIASYIPTYVSKTGDYVINKTYDVKFQDPSYPNATFKYVVSGDDPHYYNGVNTITANIYLSPVSAADPNFYKQFLGLHIKYVDADNGKSFTNDNGKPLSDFIWDVKPDKSSDVRSIKNGPSDIKYDNNPYVLVDKDDVWTNSSSNPNHIIGSDGLQHPYKLSVSDKSQGKYIPIPVSFTESDGTVVKSDMRTLPSLNWVMNQKDNNSDHFLNSDYYDDNTPTKRHIASDLHWLHLLMSTDSNDMIYQGHWIPVRVDYFDNVLDTNNKTKANTDVQNNDPHTTPIFNDVGFPSDINQGAGNLRVLYNKLGSAFLQGTIIIALHKPQEAHAGFIRFVDEDNFKDENNNSNANSDTMSDNVGAHYIDPNKWDIPLGTNNDPVNSSTISTRLKNELSDLNKHGLLIDSDNPGSSDGRVYRMSLGNGTSKSDNSDLKVELPETTEEIYPDVYHYQNNNKLIDVPGNRSVTLSDFKNKNSVYTIFLRHRPRITTYPKLNIIQNILANFVYSDGQNHHYDVPDSDVPGNYQGKGSTQKWYPDQKSLLYPAQWFNHDKPNIVSYIPHFVSDAYDGKVSDKPGIDVKRVHNGNINYTQDGRYIVKTPVSDQIGGFKNSDVVSSLMFAHSGDTILDNIISPFVHYDSKGLNLVTSDNSTSYDSDANIEHGDNDMAVIPPYRTNPSDVFNAKAPIFNYLDELASNSIFKKSNTNNSIHGLNDSDIDSKHLLAAARSKDPVNALQAYFEHLDHEEILNPKQALALLDDNGLNKNVYQVFTYVIQSRNMVVHYYDARTHMPIANGAYDFEYRNGIADHNVEFPNLISDFLNNNQDAIPQKDTNDNQILPQYVNTLEKDSNKNFIPSGYVWTGASDGYLNQGQRYRAGITRIVSDEHDKQDIHTMSYHDYVKNGLSPIFSQIQADPLSKDINGKFSSDTVPNVLNVYLVKSGMPHISKKTADETITVEINGNSNRSQWPTDISSKIPSNKAYSSKLNSDKNGFPSDNIRKTVHINGKKYKAVIVPSNQSSDDMDSSDSIRISNGNDDVIPGYVPSGNNDGKKAGEFVPWHTHTTDNNGVPHYHYHYVINYVPVKKADEYIKFEINGKAVTPNADLPGVPSYIKNGIHQSSSDQFHNSDWTPFTPPVIVINQAGQYRYDSKYGRKYYPHIVPIVSKHAGPISGATIPGFMPGSDGNTDEYNPSYRLNKNVNQYDEYVVNYVVNYTPYKVANENVKFEINGNPAAQVSGVPSYMKTGIQQHANDQSDKDDWVPFEPQVVTINGVKYEPHIIPANNYNGPSSDGTISSFTSDASDGKTNEYNGRYYAGVNKNGASQYDVNYVVNYTPEKEANEYIRYEINGKDISSNVKVPSYMKEPATTPRQTTNNQSDASDWTPVTPPSLIINGQKYVPNIEPDANYPAAKETIPSFTPNGSDSSSQFDNHYRTGISNGVIQFKVHYVVNYTPVREAKGTVTYEVNSHPIDTVPGFPSYMYNGVQQTSNTVTNRSDWLPITPPIVTVQSSKHDQKYGMKYYPHIVPIVSKNAGPIAGQSIPGFVPGADLNSRTDVDEYNEKQYGSAYEYNPQYFTGLSKNGVAKYFVHYIVDYTPYKAANENISFEVNGKPASQVSDVPAYMKAGVQQNANDQSDKDDWVPFEPQVITINGIKYDPHIVPVKSQHTGPSSNGTISSFTSDASDGKADEYNGRYYAGVNKNGASQYNVNYVVNYTPEKAAGEHVQIVVNGKPSSLVPSDINRSDTISDGHNWPAIQLPQLHGYTPEVIAQPNVESLDINNGVIPGYVPNNGDTGMYSPTIYNGVQNSKQYYYVDYVIDYVPEAAGEFVQYEVNGQPSNKVPSDITRSSTVASDQNWPAITIPQLPGYRADVLMQPAINQIKNGTIPAYQTSSDVQTGEYSSKLADGTQHGAPYYYAPYIINYVPEKAHETVHYEVNGKPSKLVPSDISRQSGGSDTSNWNSIPLPHVPGYHPEIVQQPASDGVNNNEIPGYDTSSNQNGEFNSRHYDKSDNSYDVHYIINYVPTERATEHVHFEVNGKAVKPGSIKGLPNDVYHYDFPSDGKPNWGPVQVPSSIVINGQTYVPEIVAQPSDAMITKGRVPGYTANDVDHSGEYSMTHVVPGTNGTDFNVNYVINYVPQPASGPAAHTGETIRYEINGKLVPSGSIPGLPSDVNRSDTSSDQNQGWNPADVPSQITINGKTYIPVVIAEPGDMPVANGQVPGYTFSDEFMGSHYVGNNYFHVTYIINYVPKNEPATAKVVIVYPNHHKKTYVIHGDQGTPINYKQFIPKHERYHFGKHDMVIINNHTNVIYIIPKHRSKLVIRVPKRGRITRRIVTIHHVPYLIVRRGKLIIRKIRLTSPRVHKAATPRHKLPQTGESTVHTSVWATVFAGLATVMASLGHAIGFKKHRE